MQDEAERNQASGTSVYTPGEQNQARSTNYMEMAKVRCYECQGHGHYGRDCPNKGKGIKCYNCNGYAITIMDTSGVRMLISTQAKPKRTRRWIT